MRAVLSLLAFSSAACVTDLDLSAREPVAVGAQTTLHSGASVLRCNDIFDCSFIGASITAIELDPTGVFERADGADPAAGNVLRAVSAGKTTVRASGFLDGSAIDGEVEIEAAEVARAEAVLAGGFSLRRFVIAPGTSAQFEVRVFDGSDRPLIWDGLSPLSDPAGKLTMTFDGYRATVQAPAEPLETKLVSARGETVSEVKVARDVTPERIEVVVPDARGAVVPVVAVGVRGEDHVISGDADVVFQAKTPAVCNSEGLDQRTFKLGATLEMNLLAPGTCEVSAKVSLPGGTFLEDSGSGRVAPIIQRNKRS